MKSTRKIVSLVLAAVLLLSVFVITPISASAYSVPSESDFVAKLNQLRSKYPNGGSWEGVYRENGVEKAWQCYAYANQMLYEVFGARFYADGFYNQKDYNMGTIYAGDWVRIVTYGEPNNHSIFITKVTNDRYYFTDGNWDGKNGIRWDASYTKAELAAKFSYKVHIPGNTLTGNGTPSYSPEGTLDIVSSDQPGRIFVRGWAFDRDNLNAALTMHVYIGKQEPNLDPNCELHAIVANTERTDLDNMYHVGKNHGFSAYIDTSLSGDYNVYVYAINIGSGSNALIGQKSVTIQAPYSPEGTVDMVTANNPGKIFVRGWAFDRDDLGQALSIHVYIGQQEPNKDPNCEFHVIKADTVRTDLDNMYHVGENHGFSSYIETQKTGSQNVYVYAINIGGGSNAFIGSKNVTITPAPATEPTSSENNSTESSSSENQPTEPSSNESQPTEPTSSESQPTEPSSSESNPTEPSSSESQPVETQPSKTDISKWNVSGIKNKTYTGSVIKQDNIIVSKDGEYADFSVKYKNNLNVGTATVTITGTGDYTGTIVKTFKITKAANPITVKVTTKTVKLAAVKKKAQTVKAITVSKAQGKVSYKLTSVPKALKKFVKINSKGVITISKWAKAKKGTYKIKVKISAAGNKNYNSKLINKTVTIKVK